MLGAVSLGLLLSFTRAAWVGAFVAGIGAFVLLKLYRERRFWKWMALAVALMTVIIAAGKVPPKYFERLKTLEDARHDDAMTPRYERWAYFYERSLERPWLGWGIVADAKAMETLEAAVSPHNSFIFLAVQRGWIATGIMTALLLLLWKEGWAAIKAAPDEPRKGLAVGLFAGAVGMFGIGGNFTTLWEDRQCSVVFWLLLAITFRLRHTFSELSESHEHLEAESDPASPAPVLTGQAAPVADESAQGAAMT
jgi:O-antigen ligase